MNTDLKSIIRSTLSGLLGSTPKDDQPLNLDSITLIDLIESIERDCNIRISPEDLVPENFSSVKRIILFFESKL